MNKAASVASAACATLALALAFGGQSAGTPAPARAIAIPSRTAIRPVFRMRRRAFATSTKIQNVVVIIMENRTPDNLFAAYYNTPYANGLMWGVGAGPEVVNPLASPTLSPVSLEESGDPDHEHDVGFALEFAGGSQNGWNLDPLVCRGTPCAPSAYGYVPAAETGIYANLAEHFAFADHVLQANEGPSFVAHQYLIAGQSGGINAASAPYAAAENTITPPPGGRRDGFTLHGPIAFDRSSEASMSMPDYCTGQSKSVVRTLNMTNPYAQELNAEETNPTPAPCFNYETVLQEIGSGSWEYHWSNFAYWAAPAAVAQLYKDPGFTRDPGGVAFVREASNAKLPPLSYVTPCMSDSDHPNFTKNSGPQWVASLLNAIGKNPKQWRKTAVFLVWDDWGGWYDHVQTENRDVDVYPNMLNPPPNPIDPNEWGFRVPLIAISPYAKVGYVSKTWRSFSAILNFIEGTFSLPPLGTDDAYVDDLTDMFDFTHMSTPTWHAIPTPVPAFTPCGAPPTP